MNSLIGLDAVIITAIAITTAVIIMNKCSANPIAVRTESIEKTRSTHINKNCKSELHLHKTVNVSDYSCSVNFLVRP